MPFRQLAIATGALILTACSCSDTRVPRDAGADAAFDADVMHKVDGEAKDTGLGDADAGVTDDEDGSKEIDGRTQFCRRTRELCRRMRLDDGGACWCDFQCVRPPACHYQDSGLEYPAVCLGVLEHYTAPWSSCTRWLEMWFRVDGPCVLTQSTCSWT